MQIIRRKCAAKFSELKRGELFLWGGELYMKVAKPLENMTTSEIGVFLETGELITFNPTEHVETVQNMILAPAELVSKS